MTLICAHSVVAQNEVFDTVSVTMANDSIFIDSLQKDTSSVDSTTLADSVKPAKRRLVSSAVNTTVNYNARDSILMDMSQKKAYLYGDAHVDYGKINLDAAYIEIDWVKSEVFARGMPDSTGKDTIGLPVFQEGSDQFVAKEMRYNFKTSKGIIKEVVTKEGDGYIHGETVKMNEKKELFIGDAVYTTCNLEHPHFAIVSNKIKIVPEKVAVTGPFNLQIADIKTPIGGPFGLFPLPDENVSGLIMPVPGENRNGFFLKGLGYYLNIKDYVGIRLTTDLYTNSSWRLRLENKYLKRYAFGGNLDLSIARNKEGFDQVESLPLDYKVRWNHRPQGNTDGKITSSVNIQSANFNRNNEFDVNRAMMNNFNSSISYSKQLGKSPFRLSAALRQTQTNGIQNYTLPDLSFNMRRIQPFKALKGKSSIWYKQIGIGYTMNAKNVTQNVNLLYGLNGILEDRDTVEIDFLNFNTYTQNSKNGIQHSIPLTLPSFKLLKHFTFTPTARYNEYWYGKKLEYALVDSINKFGQTEINGFSRAYQYSFSTKLNTRMYGYLNLPKVLPIQRIKHTMTPSITYTYKPDFADESMFGNKFYQTLVDTNGTESQLSRYRNFVYGGPSKGEQQTVSFSLANIFEARVKNNKDTTGKPKYIKLLDNLSARTSYNFVADSMNLSDLSITARTTLSGVSLNFTSRHDFYDFDETSRGTFYRINELATKDGRIAPRLEVLRFNASTSLNPKIREKLKKLNNYEAKDEQEEAELEQIRNNLDDYIDFDIPWNLRLEYNFDWRQNFTKDDRKVIQSLKMSGDLSLTPKWKFRFSNAGYDITNKKILPMSVGVVRDLHCWDMRFDYQPFGIYKGFKFNISVKSSALQGLKYSMQDDHTNR